METHGLQHEFVYKGTARSFADYLWQRETIQYKRFRNGELRWADCKPQPKISRLEDGTPYMVEYWGIHETTIIDPATGNEREIHESAVGISFALDPLPNGDTHIIAQCHNIGFEAWYFQLLKLFDAQPDAKPADSKSSADTPRQNAAGRPRDKWNQHAIDQLMAGNDPKTVRANWCADFEKGAKIHPSATDDGEEKTWQRRVWNPYRGAKGAK